MTLATASLHGRPSARTVLLKGFDQQGFIFYTNYESRKGQELAENPQAALLFTWLELERQIRIEGKVEKIGATASLAYFQKRPKTSQIGAWASPQSRVIADRSQLERKETELSIQYATADALPLPPFWGRLPLTAGSIRILARSAQPPCTIAFVIPWKKGLPGDLERLAP